jgi:hypothetical protein
MINLFRPGNFAFVDGPCSLVKMGCESQWIVRRVGTDSGGRWRDQLGTGLREANAEIQSGSYFNRVDRSDDFDRGVVLRVGGFS